MSCGLLNRHSGAKNAISRGTIASKCQVQAAVLNFQEQNVLLEKMYFTWRKDARLTWPERM